MCAAIIPFNYTVPVRRIRDQQETKSERSLIIIGAVFTIDSQ